MNSTNTANMASETAEHTAPARARAFALPTPALLALPITPNGSPTAANGTPAKGRSNESNPNASEAAPSPAPGFFRGGA